MSIYDEAVVLLSRGMSLANYKRLGTVTIIE